MKFLLYRRDFTDLAVQPALEFKVERYSKTAMGGCKQATISASGEPDQLWALLNHLRAPVEIRTDRGDLVWWGYLNGLETEAGFGAELTTMFNRVAVAFTDQNIRYTTQWSEDADLVAEYGAKEILLSSSGTTETSALGLRDTTLAAKKKPVPVLKDSGSGNKATLTCLGWFQTIDWQYYVNLSGKESFEISGDGEREIGEDDRPIVGQSFQIAAASAWTATSIWLQCWKVGAPIDNLVVSLKADDAGVPGTTLASGQLGADDIGTESDWLEFVLNVGVELQPATTYWIQVARSGAVVFEGPDYFMVDANSAGGYANGSMLLYNTNISAWAAETGYPGDLLFKVVGNVETTSQIVTLITTCGQFFAGSIIESVSGIESNPYRFGDTPGLYELLKLLNAGTSNHRRLLCEVTPNRYLRVFEEAAVPANPLASYGLTKDGKLVTQYLTWVDPISCPVGFWCHQVDVIPPTVDLSIVADPSLFFIEEAEYDVAADRYMLTRTRDQADIFDIGGTSQG